MQGLILAAGMGSRLEHITKNRPKVLLEVQGTPLILYALERLFENGVEETFIVVGYMKEMIIETCGDYFKSMKITYVYNEIYESTNNVYSFYLASKLVTQDLLLVEGDLLFSRNILDEVVKEKRDCNIVVSKYNPQTMDGTVIIAQDNQAKCLVIKSRQGENFDYDSAWKTVNIYYFGQDFITQKLAHAVDLYVSNGNLNNYYELVLGALIYYGDDDIQITVVDESEWYEVDDENDYMIAQKHGSF